MGQNKHLVLMSDSMGSITVHRSAEVRVEYIRANGQLHPVTIISCHDGQDERRPLSTGSLEAIAKNFFGGVA
jgi:hypothetical protein